MAKKKGGRFDPDEVVRRNLLNADKTRKLAESLEKATPHVPDSTRKIQELLQKVTPKVESPAKGLERALVANQGWANPIQTLKTFKAMGGLGVQPRWGLGDEFLTTMRKLGDARAQRAKWTSVFDVTANSGLAKLIARAEKRDLAAMPLDEATWSKIANLVSGEAFAVTGPLKMEAVGAVRESRSLEAKFGGKATVTADLTVHKGGKGDGGDDEPPGPGGELAEARAEVELVAERVNSKAKTAAELINALMAEYGGVKTQLAGHFLLWIIGAAVFTFVTTVVAQRALAFDAWLFGKSKVERAEAIAQELAKQNVALEAIQAALPTMRVVCSERVAVRVGKTTTSRIVGERYRGHMVTLLETNEKSKIRYQTDDGRTVEGWVAGRHLQRVCPSP